GMVKSREKIRQADVVLYLFDLNKMDADGVASSLVSIVSDNRNVVPVANKIDEAPPLVVQNFEKQLPEALFISAKNNKGIDALKEKLFIMSSGNNILSENIVVTNARHYNALQTVSASLSAIRKGIDDQLSGDLLSPDIRACLHYLGEITGEVTNEDTLDYIFSKFCIGK
ncbi:MAG: tRNA uridine-5-carboxymethylaminomethyl(34) synthesis GTPase MnmE, partial [Ginsengibacter sp.]